MYKLGKFTRDLITEVIIPAVALAAFFTALVSIILWVQ